MDCSPDAPQLTKSAASITQPGYGYGVDVNPKDGYAYVTVSTGNHGALCVFDVDPVDETHETGSVGFTYLQICVAYYDDKAHNKDYVYVGGVYLNGLATVDVTDPASPQIVNVVDTGLTPAMLNDMVIVGKYLYVAAQWGGILVFDLTNPALPNMVGHTPWGYGTVINSNSVAVTSDGLTGFYTDGYEVNPDMDDYVKSVNLSDKSAPTVEDSLWVPTHFSSNMDIQGKTLYLNCGYSGNLLIIDITDPTNLATISTTSIGGYSDIVVRGNNAYLTGGSLSVFDISEPLAVHQVGVSLGLPGGGVCVKEVCGKLYIAISNTATHLSIVSLY
jgi:hypothetical protein